MCCDSFIFTKLLICLQELTQKSLTFIVYAYRSISSFFQEISLFYDGIYSELLVYWGNYFHLPCNLLFLLKMINIFFELVQSCCWNTVFMIFDFNFTHIHLLKLKITWSCFLKKIVLPSLYWFEYWNLK